MRPLLIVFVCFGLVTCSTTPSLVEQIRALGELRVVTRNSPISHYVGLDGPMGPEYDLARGLADRLGVGLHIFVPESFDTTLDELVARRAHIAAAGLTVTPARHARVDFGPAYSVVQPQLVQRQGDRRVSSVEALAGLEEARIEVLAGSSHAEQLARLAEEHPTLHWHAIQGVDVDELLSRVTDGEADFTVVDSSEFMVARHLYPELRAVLDLGDPEPVAWALTRRLGDASLREVVSAHFATLDAEAELAAIFQRYLEPVQDFDYVGTRAFVRHFDTRLPRYRDYFIEAAAETGFDWRLLAAIG